MRDQFHHPIGVHQHIFREIVPVKGIRKSGRFGPRTGCQRNAGFASDTGTVFHLAGGDDFAVFLRRDFSRNHDPVAGIVGLAEFDFFHHPHIHIQLVFRVQFRTGKQFRNLLHGLHLKHPRQNRMTREMPLEKRFIHGKTLVSHSRCFRNHFCTVQHQHGTALRQKAFDRLKTQDFAHFISPVVPSYISAACRPFPHFSGDRVSLP